MSKRLFGLPMMLLVLAGCGSSSGTPASSSGGGTPVSLEAQNKMFTPATITARSGDTITVTITNKDGFDHNFSISELKVNQDVPKGTSKSVTFTASGTTNLQFFCEYHKSMGMVGTLNLGGSNAPGGSSSPASGATPGYGSTY